MKMANRQNEPSLTTAVTRQTRKQACDLKIIIVEEAKTKATEATVGQKPLGTTGITQTRCKEESKQDKVNNDMLGCWFSVLVLLSIREHKLATV